MESYFLKLYPLENESIDKFMEELGACNIGIKEYSNDYLLAEAFILRLQEDNQKLKELSIEGCFSWFEESLETVYALIDLINKKVTAIEIRRPDNIQVPFSKEVFKSEFMDFYKEKYRQFESRYGQLNTKLPPDKSFYDYVERITKKSFLQKLFGK